MRILIQLLTVTVALALGAAPAPAQEASSDLPLLPLEQSSPSTSVGQPVTEAAPAPAEPQTDAMIGAESTPPAETPAAPAPTVESPAVTPQEIPSASAPAADAEFQTGLSAYNKQDFATAAGSFESAIRNNPQSVDAYFYLGYSLYKLKRFDESRQAFTQAYSLQSGYKPPLPAAK